MRWKKWLGGKWCVWGRRKKRLERVVVWAEVTVVQEKVVRLGGERWLGRGVRGCDRVWRETVWTSAEKQPMWV